MKQFNITLMNDGSLFDVDSYGESLYELLPTIYRVDVGNKSYSLGEDSNEFFKAHNNATEVTIHLLAFQDEIDIDKVDF